MLQAPFSRLVVLTNQVLIVGNVAVPVYPVWPAKDPSEVLVYGADFARRIAGTARIARVAPPQPGILPAGAVNVVIVGVEGTRVHFRISGGVDGVPATVPIKIETTDTQVFAAQIILPIVALSGVALLADFPPGSFVLDPVTGYPVLDPNTGQPILAPIPYGVVLDPLTGQPVLDPTTGKPIHAPAQMGVVLDPATGKPVLDPLTGQPVLLPISRTSYVVDPQTGQVVRDPVTNAPIEAP